MNEAEFERHVQTGLRNKEVWELVHNFCSHATVVNRGGVGLIAQMTGLPLGMLGLSCDHAHVGGMAGWYLEETAVDFYDRNCNHCDKRAALRLPNLLQLIDQRDRAVEARRAADKANAVAAESAHQARIARRASLRIGQSAATCSLLDDIDALDESRSSDAKTKVVETARLAPEVFTTPIVEYFFELATSSEMNLHEQALLVLRKIGADRGRVTEAALECLAKHVAVEVAADIVMASPSSGSEEAMEKAVRALISLARLPESQLPVSVPARRPGPLRAVYKARPDTVCRVIQALLDYKSSYPIRLGIAALEVLGEDDVSLLPRFARAIIAKLTRANLLIDEDEADRELQMVCGDMSKAVAAALLSDPENTDALIADYFTSASSEGEERLSDVYERVSRRSMRSKYLGGTQLQLDEKVNAVVLKRLLSWAGKSSNGEVLSNVVQAFRNEPEELVSAARQNIDAPLGTAAVLDDRMEACDREKSGKPATTLLEQLDADNLMQSLRQLRDSCAAIAATAAKGNLDLTTSYVGFLANVDERRDGLSSTLLRATPHLIDRPSTLNLVLPHLYSAMVGTSVLRRAAAAEALGDLGKGLLSDLPSLVLEAFVLLLHDRYVLVHKRAVEALPSVALPTELEGSAESALLSLVLYYQGKKDEHNFLLRCMALYLRRFSTPAKLSRGYRRAFIKFLMGVPASSHVDDFARMASDLCAEPIFVDLVGRVFEDRKLSEYGEEDACRLVNSIPDSVALDRAEDLASFVRRNPQRLSVAGSVIELLTRVGAWSQAVSAIEATWTFIPDTAPERRFKMNRRLHVVAVQFEAAVAAGDVPRQQALKAEWIQIESALEEDRKRYAERRSALPSFLQPDSGN
ncbi:hypothetical protein [Roseateles sp. LYH14W]|uniref:HEAT repeat domain-containing protein n=1 Tax=Pelomonas parva TaxID=3299032 RepID=A0ABW7FAV4_9BURK